MLVWVSKQSRLNGGASGSAAGALAADELAPQYDNNNSDKGWENGWHMLPSVKMNGHVVKGAYSKQDV